METENSLWINIDSLNPRPGPGWKYADGVLTEPIYPLEPPSKIITKVAFRFRFTDAEYAAILAATKTDAEVQAWYETFNMVATIDLDNQRTKDGVANLVSKNLLTQARADEILTAPVQPGERA
jgi:hypothetical protein